MVLNLRHGRSGIWPTKKLFGLLFRFLQIQAKKLEKKGYWFISKIMKTKCKRITFRPLFFGGSSKSSLLSKLNISRLKGSDRGACNGMCQFFKELFEVYHGSPFLSRSLSIEPKEKQILRVIRLRPCSLARNENCANFKVGTNEFTLFFLTELFSNSINRSMQSYFLDLNWYWLIWHNKVASRLPK